MKKLASICFVLIIAFALTAGTAAAAPRYEASLDPDYAVMLIDADTGYVLFEQNADKQIRPASTTKILTALITIENSQLDSVVTIGPEGDWSDKSDGYSKLKTKEGEQMSMKDLLYGMMLVSGGDAADAIAVQVAGSTENFVNMMNEKAKELGMASSHFENVGGVDSDGHYVTARDMAKLTLEAMRNPQFADIVRLWAYDMPETNKNPSRTINNTNLLLDPAGEYYYQYADGIKTGSTPKAGDCLVSSATKDGMRLLCLFYSGKTTFDRWNISKDLFEWGFENYKTIDAAPLIKSMGKVEAQLSGYSADDSGGGLLQFKEPELDKLYLTLEKSAAQALLDGTDAIEVVPSFNKPLAAPVSEGDVLGTASCIIKSTGEAIYTFDLIASRDVAGETAPQKTQAPPSATATAGNPAQEGSNDGFPIVPIIAAAAAVVLIVVVLIIINVNRRNKRRSRRYGYGRK